MTNSNPALEWLSDTCLGAAVGLGSLQSFQSLPQDITMRTKPWQKWCDLEMPENEKLPLDYKNKSEFQKLLVNRALRPDRMNQIGEKYTEDAVFSLQQTYKESTPTMALFFILSPGIDTVKSVQILGEKLGFTEKSSPTGLATIEEYKEYALREFQDESPHLFGMLPNAEIGSLTTLTKFIFNTLLGVQPRIAGAEEGDTSMEKSVKKTLEEIIPNIPELYNRIENNYLAAYILESCNQLSKNNAICFISFGNMF